MDSVDFEFRPGFDILLLIVDTNGFFLFKVFWTSQNVRLGHNFAYQKYFLGKLLEKIYYKFCSIGP